MSALMWSVERSIASERGPRPQLRLLPGLMEEPSSRPMVGGDHRAVVAGAQCAEPTWELTRRGVTLALAGLATVFAGATATLIWGFFQVSNAPLM